MRRNLYLYLALACFLGLLAIFVVDGYIGVYDTVYITAGEQEYKIESDAWQNLYPIYSVPAPGTSGYAPVPVEGGRGSYGLSTNRGDKISFRYEVDNREFSTYEAVVDVSVWHSQQKVRNVVSHLLSISAFAKESTNWDIDNTQLLPSDIPPEQSYQYTVIITRGEIERKIVVSINPLVYK